MYFELKKVLMCWKIKKLVCMYKSKCPFIIKNILYIKQRFIYLEYMFMPWKQNIHMFKKVFMCITQSIRSLPKRTEKKKGENRNKMECCRAMWGCARAICYLFPFISGIQCLRALDRWSHGTTWKFIVLRA